MGRYEILKRVRKVSYELKLARELTPIRPVFHVSVLKKSIGSVSVLPIGGLGVSEYTSYEEIQLKS